MTESDTLNARVCRKCGAEPGRAYDTRISADDIVIRRRECAECGNRWVTVEIDRRRYKELVKAAEGRQ